MVKTEEYQLHPLGWENDPEVERIRFSTFDYLAATVYNSYTLFFALKDEEKAHAVEVLKAGLERTLSQCRQLVGTIEKNDDNDDHSFVKKRDSTVKFVVKYFEAEDNAPSISDLQKAHFVSTSLGDTTRFVVEGMEYGEKPETMPNANPVIAAFQANFIPGGLVFVINQHHYANDAMGWANFVHQLAENCAADVNKTAPPAWDPANLDATRFTATDFPSDKKVDGPTSPDRHPGLKEHAALLFHLPLSKAAKLKELATPQDGSWISTYDAFTAYLWRAITRRRAELYGASPSDPPLFAEGVNMRKRADPPVAPRLQRNLFWAAVSAQHPSPLTVEEISSSLPLSQLASKIRSMTNATGQGALDVALTMLAPIRDKTSLFTRVNAFPPLTMATTDWRDAEVCTADFGFGRPIAYRHLFNAVTEGLVLIYPGRPAAGADEGCEFVLTIEKDIIKGVQEDVAEYFEFRGYEVELAQ